MTTTEELQTRWTAFRNPAEDDEGVALDQFTADSLIVVYSDQGGEGDNQVVLRLGLAFESAADFAAFLRYSELPRCIAWDSGSRVEFVDDYDAYLSGYNEARQQEISDCAALLEAGVIGESHVDEFVGAFNRTCAITEPRLFAMAWGDIATVLRNPKFSDDFAEILSYEPDGQVAQAKALLDNGTFDASNEEHLDLAIIALEELEEY